MTTRDFSQAQPAKDNAAGKRNKRQDSLRLGNEYPLYEDAQKFIDALTPGIDKSSLHFLTNSFRGFSQKMQRKMVECLLDEYCGRIDGETSMTFTGIWHVDRLLMEIVYKLDHDTKNIDYNEY